MDELPPPTLLTLPAELTAQVIDSLTQQPSPRDILQFTLCSRACYNICSPYLHRHLDWTIGVEDDAEKEAQARMDRRAGNMTVMRDNAGHTPGGALGFAMAMGRGDEEPMDDDDDSDDDDDDDEEEEEEHGQPERSHAYKSRLGRQLLILQPAHFAEVRSIRLCEDPTYKRATDRILPPSFRQETSFEGEWAFRTEVALPKDEPAISPQVYTMAIRDRTPALVRRPDPRFARIAAESKEYFNLIPHFTHLHTITLRSVSLPRDFYETLHGLHGTLRSVLVRGCRLTSPYPKTLDPADLIRLEELMFVQIAFDANLDRRLPSCSPRKLKSLLKLARAPNLRVLTLDRSVEAALPSLGPFLPATLHTVRLDFRGTSPPRRRPAVALFQFFSFLTMVRRLEMTEIHLSTEPEGGVGKYFRGHLMSLEELVAPMAYVHALFCEGRNIRRVSIVDAPAKNPPLIGFCNVSDVETALAHLGTGIEHVEFNLKQWDKEALYMLSIMAPRVRVIKIAFCVGGVDDDYFMTVGNMIEFPCLETLHLYRLGDSITLPQSPNKNKMDLHINGGVNKDRLEDQKEYMIIWQRHMPYLREVALCSDVVWVNSLALSAPPAGSDLSLPVSRLCLSKGKKKGVCGWEPRFVKGMEGVKGLVG